MKDHSRQLALWAKHPPICPVELPRSLSGVMRSPPKLAPTAKLREFRDFVATLAEDAPDNPNWPAFVRQVENAIAWREAQPPANHFWRPDPA